MQEQETIINKYSTFISEVYNKNETNKTVIDTYPTLITKVYKNKNTIINTKQVKFACCIQC